MKTGDVVIVSFPFTDFSGFKARPAVVVSTTNDQYDDVIVALISSVVPSQFFPFQIHVLPDNSNGLKVPSIIKVSRLATVENRMIAAHIGKLSENDLLDFKRVFNSLIK